MTNTSLNSSVTADEIDALLHPWLDMLDAIEEDAETYGPEYGRGGESRPAPIVRAEVEELRRDVQHARDRLISLVENDLANFGRFYARPVR